MARAAPQRESWGPAPAAPAPRSDPAAPCGLRHGPLRPWLRGSARNVCARRAGARHGAAAKVAPGPRGLLVLLAVGAAAAAGASADSHSYRHLYTGVSNPGPDVPAFTAVGYVDDQQILHYDSETRRQEPCRDWVRGAVDPDFWYEETGTLQGWQRGFDVNLITLQHRYNQSRGSRTLQLTYGCELREDNSTGGHMQWGYDGGDFIGYDLGARTWVAGTAQAQVTQHSWNQDAALLRRTRAYLEETCVAWLRQYLQRGEAALQSKRPVAQVSDRPSSRDGRTTLSCWVHGFYPQDVAVAWLKDGEAQPQETSRSGVLPSGDGTYQTWATIEMDPSSNHDYACSVEHASLGAALRVAWDKGRTASDPALIVGIVIGVVLVIALAGAAVSFRRKRAVGCRAVPVSFQGLESKASEKAAVENSGACQRDGPDPASSVNFNKVLFTPSSKSLMEMVNSAGPGSAPRRVSGIFPVPKSF